MQAKFIHLRLHSEFSLVDGLVKVKPLASALAELSMPAVAITDQSNFFSLVKFYRASLGKGIKPIAGADIYLLNPADFANPFCLTLLAKNNIGYRVLTELLSKAYQEGQHQGVPMVKREWIEQNNEGLIALSGAIEGDIGAALLADEEDKAQALAEYWQALFPQSFYLEIQRIGKAQEENYLAKAVALATSLNLPVVATNNVRFLKPENFEAHEIRVCINQGRVIDDNRRPKDYTVQQYLRSTEEMLELFSDVPEALANTVEIAKRCNIELTLGKNFLPDFPVPEGMSLDEFFIDESEKGLNARLEKYPAIGQGTPEENRRAYDARLKMELDTIVQMGFPGYFMIVADFIQWAKDNLIPVGPGRGSGAGSLVAYVLNITDLDPIEFDLLFERFLNPERVSMPDFDVDFCMDRRDEVIDYVAQNYGREKVSQIITYGSMAAKAVIRDVGRVLSHPYGFVDRLSKLVPFEIGMTLTKALAAVPEFQELYDTDEEVKALMDMALSLEGTVRNAGKHAGGVVIAPTKLTDFSALYCEQGGGNLVTQFDKDDVEAVGLVKFDFLGLRTLTIIDWALQTINKKQAQENKPLIDITQIPRDDKASYDLLIAAQTTAVFQLESRGMKELIKKLKPDCFDDIIALVALFRPGPLESGMVDDYINVKHGAKAEYAHPSLESVLEPTNGVILYQEQVMQIAREMGGYTLGGADLLRRAMGKKKLEEMAQQRALFTQGAVDNKVEESTATYVFDLMEKFAGYGFNKTVAENTEIYTQEGIKLIKNCQAGDVVLSRTQSGDLVYSQVVELHDHGKVPLWEIIFDDGTIERCTLDHKWLTEEGQQPLWKIIQMGGKVWGGATHQARYSCSSKTMSCLYGDDSDRAFFRKRASHVLWRKNSHQTKSIGAFSSMREMPKNSSRNTRTNLQRFRAYARNARKVFRNSKNNLSAFRYSAAESGCAKKMARRQSRILSCDSCQSSCLPKMFKNGDMVRTLFKSSRFCTQHPVELSGRAQANRFYSSRKENRYRGRRALAFFAHSIRESSTKSASARPAIKSRDSQSILAINPSIDAMLQRKLWTTYLTRATASGSSHQRWQLGGDTVLRKPIRATFMGWNQGYDLEVDHPEHNFMLASGLCCSNSHSAAYALVAYQTAWLKAHYPPAFMAAVLSSDMDNTDKVVILVNECAEMGIKICSPNINLSYLRFTVNEANEIVYGIGAIKGVGEAAIEDLLTERETNGAFKGLYDLCKRVDLRKVNKRVFEALIRGGAFDVFNDNRASHMAELPTAIKVAERHGKMAEVGQNDLFGLAVNAETRVDEVQDYAQSVEVWSEKERLGFEKLALGLFLTGHPIDQYRPELKNIVHGRIADVVFKVEKSRGKIDVRLAGMLVGMRTRLDRKGKNMCFATLDDKTARLEVAIYSEVFESYKDVIKSDEILVVEGSAGINHYSGDLSVTAEKIYTMEQARESFVRSLAIKWDSTQITTKTADFMHQLETTLQPFLGGQCPLMVHYSTVDDKAIVQLGDTWRIHPTDELLSRLQRLLGGVGATYLRYR